MAKRNILTRILAIGGTVLVGLPILAPLVLAVLFWFKEGVFRLDYLMPMELIFVALLGGCVLLLAAVRAHSRWRGSLGWALGVAAASPPLAQGLAVLTGLASRERVMADWPMGLVLAFVVLYSLALIVMVGLGVLLTRQVFQQR